MGIFKLIKKKQEESRQSNESVRKSASLSNSGSLFSLHKTENLNSSKVLKSSILSFDEVKGKPRSRDDIRSNKANKNRKKLTQKKSLLSLAVLNQSKSIPRISLPSLPQERKSDAVKVTKETTTDVSKAVDDKTDEIDLAKEEGNVVEQSVEELQVVMRNPEKKRTSIFSFNSKRRSSNYAKLEDESESGTPQRRQSRLSKIFQFNTKQNTAKIENRIETGVSVKERAKFFQQEQEREWKSNRRSIQIESSVNALIRQFSEINNQVNQETQSKQNKSLGLRRNSKNFSIVPESDDAEGLQNNLSASFEMLDKIGERIIDNPFETRASNRESHVNISADLQETFDLIRRMNSMYKSTNSADTIDSHSASTLKSTHEPAKSNMHVSFANNDSFTMKSESIVWAPDYVFEEIPERVRSFSMAPRFNNAHSNFMDTDSDEIIGHSRIFEARNRRQQEKSRSQRLFGSLKSASIGLLNTFTKPKHKSLFELKPKTEFKKTFKSLNNINSAELNEPIIRRQPLRGFSTLNEYYMMDEEEEEHDEIYDLQAKMLRRTRSRMQMSVESSIYDKGTKISLKDQLRFLWDIDPAFVKSIFHVKAFFSPITKRKVFLYSLYIVIIALWSGMWILPNIYDVLSIMWGLDIFFVLIAYLSLDPIILILTCLFCEYPELPTEQTDNTVNPTIALIITCHNSGDVIEQTVRAALVHLLPQNIIIADNGNGKQPTDDTKEIMEQLDPEIIYRFTNIGNKTLAQYLSVRYLMKERKDIKHVMIIDDDVTISPNLRFPVEKITGNCKALVYGIRGTDTKGKQNLLWTQWQDMEYKMSDFVKIFQDTYCSVLFPHGAISLWDKEILYHILCDHDAIFYADDVKMGMWLTRRGYRLGYFSAAVVNTETPETLLGPSPNYYNQRVRSWDFAEHMLTWRHIKCFLFGYIEGKPGQTLLLKFFQFYCLYTNLVDWLKIPGIYYYVTRAPEFFTLTLSIMLILNTSCILIWNYISCRHRRDLRVTLISILTFPLYKVISSCIRTISLLRCFWVYWPRFKSKDFRPNLLTEAKIREIEAFNRK